MQLSATKDHSIKSVLILQSVDYRHHVSRNLNFYLNAKYLDNFFNCQPQNFTKFNTLKITALKCHKREFIFDCIQERTNPNLIIVRRGVKTPSLQKQPPPPFWVSPHPIFQKFYTMFPLYWIGFYRRGYSVKYFFQTISWNAYFTIFSLCKLPRNVHDTLFDIFHRIQKFWKSIFRIFSIIKYFTTEFVSMLD